jgi:ParB family chromosome partitioning protein
VLQPLLVARDGERYRLIAGERRLRAARLAGLATVPVVVRQVPEREAFLLALVENLQREDLDPIEQARAFQRLSEAYGLTQEEIARRVGKQRSTVANSVRLLRLAPPVLRAVEQGRLAEGLARALLPLPAAQQVAALERVLDGGLSARATEDLVRGLRREPEDRPEPASEPALAGYFEEARAAIERATGLPVTVTFRGNRGRIAFPFGSLAAFRRIRERLGAPQSRQPQGDQPEDQQDG